MSLLVVIPCLNEARHLEGLMKGMLADKDITALVVADGGSTDGSQAIVERLSQSDRRVHLLDNPARIQSAGVNLAVARYGEGMEWLLRVDAHCLYPPHYSQTLLKAAKEREASAVVVPMFTKGIKGFQLAVAAAQNSVLGTGGSAHRSSGEGMFVEHGHHALMKIDLFKQVGGYCEGMPCNEDAELDHRLIEAGGRIWLEPAAAIIYLPRETMGALAKQYFKYGKGRAATIKRHRVLPRLRQMIPLAVPAAMVLLPLSFVHPIFALPFFSWLALCLVVGAVVGLRPNKIRSRGGWRVLAGVAAAIMHASWGLGFLKGWLFPNGANEPRYGLIPET